MADKIRHIRVGGVIYDIIGRVEGVSIQVTDGALGGTATARDDGTIDLALSIPKPTDGRDGVAPIISVDAIQGGHRVTITDASGSKTLDIMDGRDGEAHGLPGPKGDPGPKGVDGVSPTVTITDDASAGTHTLSVTDTTGTKSTTIKDGVVTDVTTTMHGLMSVADKLKLDSLPSSMADVPTRQQLADAVAADAAPTHGSTRLVTSGGVADAIARLPLDIRGMHVHRFGLGNENTNDNRGASYPDALKKFSGCYVEELQLLVIQELETEGTLDATGGRGFGQSMRMPDYVPRPNPGVPVPVGCLVVWNSSNPFVTWNRLVYESDGNMRMSSVFERDRQTASGPMVVPLRPWCADTLYDPSAPRDMASQLIATSMAGEVA